MKKILDVEGLTKSFGGFTAVDGISFEMFEGEILGLIGPNGAGKTTTLQMLLGLTTPTAGRITVLGMDASVKREEILSQVNFSSSYVSLPLSLTVRENLMVYAMLYGVKDAGKRIERLLKTFEMEREIDSPARRLSSGQMTRLCLCKALINSPRILFLDEPTASLDPDIADKTRRLLKETRKKDGASILYTSHNMREMEELSDRVIFMQRGAIIASGSPAEIRERYGKDTLEEVFITVAREDGGRR